MLLGTGASRCLLAIGLLWSIGCAAARQPGWKPMGHRHPSAIPEAGVRDYLEEAEQSLQRGRELARRGDPGGIDHLYQAARKAWAEWLGSGEVTAYAIDPAANLYHTALAELIEQGQALGRFDPRRGLRIELEGQTHWLPIDLPDIGSNRSPVDGWIVGREPASKHLNRYHDRAGVGLPVIAIRHRRQGERFAKPTRGSAATLVLRFEDSATAADPKASPGFLSMYNPLQTSTLVVGGRSLPLRGDLSAPVALATASGDRDYLRAFLQPGSTRPDDSGLFMMEAYQAGKIPVVFVHGLLSDRLTWANMANEVRCQPDLMANYQFWSYEYPTGEPFVKSAVRLRQELQAAMAYVDPTDQDPALKHLILVGHSMGGLVSKLQVTHSGEALWRSVSCLEFDSILSDPATRAELAETMFFDPSPRIERVVFIGTPHYGSAMAQRLIGRLTSLLVREPDTDEQRHRCLIAANPGAFSEEFTQRIPTSIDLLVPDSPMLQAIASLPAAPSVQFHSVIGRGHWMIGDGDSDGVVPISSARYVESESELRVQAKHTQLTRVPEVIDEVFRILRMHAEELQIGGVKPLGLGRVSIAAGAPPSVDGGERQRDSGRSHPGVDENP
jgi:pimeloyl-ACP methyl ester carboxylesterase